MRQSSVYFLANCCCVPIRVAIARVATQNRCGDRDDTGSAVRATHLNPWAEGELKQVSHIEIRRGIEFQKSGKPFTNAPQSDLPKMNAL